MSHLSNVGYNVWQSYPVSVRISSWTNSWNYVWHQVLWL